LRQIRRSFGDVTPDGLSGNCLVFNGQMAVEIRPKTVRFGPKNAKLHALTITNRQRRGIVARTSMGIFTGTKVLGSVAKADLGVGASSG
jgi:hypothetical protein